MIFDGGLKDGDRLPPERELAAEFHASRATIREALHELELKGLVERRQGRGTTVRDIGERRRTSEALLSPLEPSERRLVEIMDFREAIEPPIAARAAKYATKADVHALEDVLEAMTATRSAAKYGELDERFHLLVARATHNPLLVQLVRLSSTWTRAIRLGSLQGARRRTTSLQGHRRILAVIRARDSLRAEEEMRKHLEEIATQLAASAGAGLLRRSRSSRRS